jgi:hypothetical protein
VTYSLSLRPRALAEVEAARDRYERVGHGDSFVDELEAVFEVIRAMPLRFPVACGGSHRALLRRYPFAVFFRIRPNTEESLCSPSFHNVAIQLLGRSADQ